MVATRFAISIHEKDRRILELIQEYFGVGNIYQNGENKVQFLVESIRYLTNVIIPHFEKFPLITRSSLRRTALSRRRRRPRSKII
jgi:hypothetical protein